VITNGGGGGGGGGVGSVILLSVNIRKTLLEKLRRMSWM
jgi:uncharacterized membrane protein